MKRKILSMVIVLSFILQAAPCFAADAENTEEVYQPYVQSESFLRALGCIDDEVEVSDGITRGEAAYYLVRMLNDQDTLGSYRGIFRDIDSGNKNALYIEKLADLGVVRGDENRNYNADDYLTYNEAYTMFANVWGLAAVPDSGLTAREVVSRYDIADGIIAEGEFVNLGDLFLMMRNILLANVLDKQSWGNDDEYGISDETLLYKRFGVKYTDGIAVKNDLTYLWTGEDADSSILEIESIDGKISVEFGENPEARGMLGCNVRVFYTDGTSQTVKRYVYHEINSLNRTLNIEFEDINLSRTSFADRKITYTQSGADRERDARLSQDYALIYNNKAYKSQSFDFSSVADKTGRAELIDNNSDGAYDVVKIYAYQTIIVGSIVGDYEKITDKFTNSLSAVIDENEYEKVLVYGEDGTATGADSITPGNIVSVAVSDTFSGDNVAEIRISAKLENGKISKYSAQGGTIVIDNNPERVLRDRAAAESHVAGRNIVAYIDAFGKVVYVAGDNGRDMQWGIIAKLALIPSSFGGTAAVKMVSLSGELVETDFADNVIIDGRSYKNKPTEVIEYMKEVKFGSLPSGVGAVKYRLNDKGEIKILDTPKSGSSGDNDIIEYMGGGQMVVNAGNVLGWTIPYYSDATVVDMNIMDFTKDDEYVKPENYKVSMVSAAALYTNNNYNVMAYKSDPDSLYADMIIRFPKGELEYGNALFVLDYTAEGYNNETEAKVTELVGYENGRSTSIFIDPNNSATTALLNLRRGDVIRHTDGTDGTVLSYETIFIQSDDGFTLSNVAGGALSTNTGSSVTLLTGYVYKRDDTMIQTNGFAVAGSDFGKEITTKASGINWAAETLYSTNAQTGASVVVVDYENEEVRTGAVSDVKDYINYKDECSLVLMRYRSNTLNEMIIYK